MKTIYIEPSRSEHLMVTARGILVRVPAVLIIGGILLMFIRDPVWPYHLIMNDWTMAVMQIFTDPNYRTWWMEHYLIVTVALVCLLIVLSVAIKMGVWNKAFKTLKVRTREEQDKIETEIGRAYWIEGWSGQGAVHFGNWVLRSIFRRNIVVGRDPKKHYRTVRSSPLLELGISRADGKTDWVYKENSPQNGEKSMKSLGETRRRTIFYKATFWPPINPFSPHRSMHRLMVTLPNEAIVVHDGTTILVEGANLKRDLTQDYPTFELTPDTLSFVGLDLEHYKTLLDTDIQKGTFTVNIASQMDTFLLKDQRKFQEISVPVNPVMAELVRGVKK